MAPNIGWRAAVAAIAIAALGLTACGKDQPSAGGATGIPTGDAQIGGAPPASTTPAPGGPTPTRGGGNNGPVYPRDARAYGQEFLRAWGNRNYMRLGQLGDQAAVQQVRDSVDTGGVPNTQWTYINCGPADQMPDLTACVFRNAHGDETVIKMIKAKLGSPRAVTAASLDRTRYPTTPEAYVDAVLVAHQNGNAQRVQRLSNASVRGKLTCTLAGGKTTNPAVPLDSTYSKVLVAGLGPDLGKSYAFTVLTQPNGKPNAVKDVANAC
jgi:hypothetical protein